MSRVQWLCFYYCAWCGCKQEGVQKNVVRLKLAKFFRNFSEFHELTLLCVIKVQYVQLCICLPWHVWCTMYKWLYEAIQTIDWILSNISELWLDPTFSNLFWPDPEFLNQPDFIQYLKSEPCLNWARKETNSDRLDLALFIAKLV